MRCVWVFCMECRVEGVYFRYSCIVSFNVKLIWYCKVGFFFEEIFWIVNIVFVVVWKVYYIKGWYVEYFICIFCIVCC